MRDVIDRLQEGAFKVSEQAQRLVRAEIALAQAEVKAKAKKAAPGVGLLVLAGALGFLSLFAIMIAIIWGIASVVPLWAAALITAAIFLVVAGLFAVVGKSILAKVGPPVPDTALGIAQQTPGRLAGKATDAATEELR